MTDNAPGEFIRFGSWLVRKASIDALGPNEKAQDESVVLLRCGRKILIAQKPLKRKNFWTMTRGGKIIV